MGSAIRRATEDDAQAIASVHVRGWRAAYRGIVPDAYLDALSVDEHTERHRSRFRVPTPGVQAWVAADGGAITGFVITGPTRPPFDAAATGEVYAIYVDPDRFRQGIGRALLDHAVEQLRREGHGRATLWVLEGNAAGRRFYEAMGWSPDGAVQGFELPDFDGEPLPEVRYVRDLG